MKKIILSFSVAFAFLMSSSALSAQDQMPSVDVKTLEGKSVNITDYTKEGQLTVISFWATWCTPCKKELDAIADIYADWQEDYNMELIAITIDDARALAKVRPMVSQKNWEYTILSDANQNLMQALSFQTVPQTFIMDGKGNIVYSHSGYVPGDEYELEDKLAELSGK